jgi:hypothetical protein
MIGAWTVVGDAGTNVYLLQTTYSEPWNNAAQTRTTPSLQVARRLPSGLEGQVAARNPFWTAVEGQDL